MLSKGRRCWAVVASAGRGQVRESSCSTCHTGDNGGGLLITTVNRARAGSRASTGSTVSRQPEVHLVRATLENIALSAKVDGRQLAHKVTKDTRTMSVSVSSRLLEGGQPLLPRC